MSREPSFRQDALDVAQTLDSYLDARDAWERGNADASVLEATRARVGETRAAFVDALEAAFMGPTGVDTTTTEPVR